MGAVAAGRRVNILNVYILFFIYLFMLVMLPGELTENTFSFTARTW